MTQPSFASIWAALGVAERSAYLVMYAIEPRATFERTIIEEMQVAARELGFALVPLTQDNPDSGRASIPAMTEGELTAAYGKGEI